MLFFISQSNFSILYFLFLVSNLFLLRFKGSRIGATLEYFVASLLCFLEKILESNTISLLDT